MRFTFNLVLALFALNAYAQPAATENPANQVQGLPARATPADYQSSGNAGTVTVAAEFLGHNIPTPKGTLNSEDYVAVEVALFGPAGEKVELGTGDFQLRVSDKKVPLPRTPYGFVFRSLKDPELEPTAEQKKAKTGGGGLSTGGGDKGPSEAPAPVKVPIEVVRDQQQRIQKSALPGGDRMLPVAGLIYFGYRGKTQNLTKIELIYNGKAGTVTIPLL